MSVTKLNTTWQEVLVGRGIVQVANTMDGAVVGDPVRDHKDHAWDGVVLMHVGTVPPGPTSVDYLEVKRTLEQGFTGKTVYARTQAGVCTVKSVAE